MPKLNFTDDVFYWSKKYGYDKPELEAQIIDEIAPRVRTQGYITKEDFLKVCEWKTDRSKSRCNKNSEDYIQEITGIALSTKNERARIEVLTLLDGVKWPTASVFLHFFHDEKYPILDYRALESLGVKELPGQYKFGFWMDYVLYCRQLSEQFKCDMRTVDRALWAFSKHSKK